MATPNTGVDDAVVRLETAYHVRGLVATLTSFDHPSDSASERQRHPSDNGSGHVVNQIVREYDDLNLLVREYQEHAGVKDGSTPSVQYAYDDTVDGNGELVKGMRLVSTTYPDGRKVHERGGGFGVGQPATYWTCRIGMPSGLST